MPNLQKTGMSRYQKLTGFSFFPWNTDMKRKQKIKTKTKIESLSHLFCVQNMSPPVRAVLQSHGQQEALFQNLRVLSHSRRSKVSRECPYTAPHPIGLGGMRRSRVPLATSTGKLMMSSRRHMLLAEMLTQPAVSFNDVFPLSTAKAKNSPLILYLAFQKSHFP